MPTVTEENKASPYVSYVRSRTPPWLSGYWGSALMDSIATMMDVVLTGAIDAIDCRYIRRTTIDALTYAGEDRMMGQAPGETTEEYRTRLSKARYYWSNAGTTAGLIEALSDVGLTVIVIEGLDIGGSAKWHHFEVYITDYPSDFYTPTWTWGQTVPSTTVWGAGRTWGGISRQAVEFLQQMVRNFKPCYSRNTKLALIVKSSGGVTIYVSPVY